MISDQNKNNSILRMKNVHVHYDGSRALKGITLEVTEGAIVVLIGANGAGKTTTLKSILNMCPIVLGEIWFKNERIDKKRTSQIVKKGITLVPEGRKIFPQMSVLENLIMGAHTRKDQSEYKKDLDYVFEHFPILKEKLKRKGKTLSGGQQQMLAIGRGLMAKPKLLLLDEPSLGLSPILVHEITSIIKTINQDSMTIMLVEQNAQMALSLAQNGYVLETGNIIIKGTTDELINNPEVKAAYLGG